jgi:hypothetical protein
VALKDRLAGQYAGLRKFSEGLIATIQSPEEWVFRVHPTANHPLWIVGHIATTDNSILKLLGSPAAVDKSSWMPLFGRDSVPLDDFAAYPSPAELLPFFRERRERFLEHLATLSDEDLAQPVPPGGPPIFTDIASVYERMCFHEAMHMGQMTVARQAMKHPRVINFQPPAR